MHFCLNISVHEIQHISNQLGQIHFIEVIIIKSIKRGGLRKKELELKLTIF